MEFEDVENVSKHRIYLPSQDAIDTKEYLNRYIQREFPYPTCTECLVYSVPKRFQARGERQANFAERSVFERIRGVSQNEDLWGTWITFFYSSSYGEHSSRNQRLGKLMIREHDFVIFVRREENDRNEYFVVLVEVKSTKDQNSLRNSTEIEKISDAKVIKNNKRSAQHQLRDHFEVLENVLGTSVRDKVQSYIMWPFLSSYTKDCRQQATKRWKEDKNLHVFEDTLGEQEHFNSWFVSSVLNGKKVTEEDFNTLLNRFIILSCGVFVDEINTGLMALLNQEQLELLHYNASEKNRVLVVHGAAGTGKTLLVLRKLELLYHTGRLNEKNRALYICYWPGIRYDVELKLEKLGLRQYVDTARFYVSMPHFLGHNRNSYRHIFMDESEAICLSFQRHIMSSTLTKIYEKYHSANCTAVDCPSSRLFDGEDIAEKLMHHPQRSDKQWGELWFMVDTNQASLFLPQHSPNILQKPQLILTKVMRSTGFIFALFKQFYSVPTPLNVLQSVKIPSISIGHDIFGPPVYWVCGNSEIDKTVARVVIDLCTNKGFKAHDLCVIPFLVNEKLVPERINQHIDQEFVEKSFRPNGIKDVEHFLKFREINDFLIAWALRVKGLEFKVVIMVIDEDDFDCQDAEDRRKAYIVTSRCTSMLIVVSTEKVKIDMDVERRFQNFPFSANSSFYKK